MASPLALDQVASALGLGDKAMVSLVGGGGKTTTMFALGRTLEPVVLTTTTRMHSQAPADITTLVGNSDEEVVRKAHDRGRVLAWTSIDSNKARGVDPERCDRWFDQVPFIVVEADGARQRPFTAPRPLEPVIPSRSTHVVACIGADAMGRCIGDQCHRPLRIAAVAGCSPYDRLTPGRAARVLLSKRGSRKGCPEDAKFSIAITKVAEADRPMVDELEAEIGDQALVITIAYEANP